MIKIHTDGQRDGERELVSARSSKRAVALQ